MSDYAIVTGAATGIGRALAKNLAKRNYNLLLTDINESELYHTASIIKSTSDISVHLLVIDLSEENAANKILAWSAPYHDSLKLVINNAGYGINAPFIEEPLKNHLNLINVNIRALVSIAYLFIPILNRQSKSWLMNVGSTTSYQSVPYLSTYSSSKAFVLSFTRSLKKELRRSNISVSCLSPGSTDTHFVDRAGMSGKTKRIASRYNMTAEKVAEIGLKGLFKEKTEIIPGVSNKLHAFLTKFLPKSLAENIAVNIYGPLKKDDPFYKAQFAAEEEDFLAV